ncbi:MAG: Flp pilus assembly protein CpaB [Bythopirellula sp.]
MRPKSLMLLALALGCGLVASIGISQVMDRDTETVGYETTSIYVALHNINLNDPIDAEMVSLQDWPKDKVPQGAITQLEELENRRPRSAIIAGEPILEAKLMAQGEVHDPIGEITEGMRLKTVRVDAEKSAAGLLSPGDRVDIQLFVNRNPGAGFPTARTRVILQNIRVYAIDQTVQRAADGGEGRTVAKTVSLLVWPEQANKIALAEQIGELNLIPRSPDDDLTVKLGEMTTDDLFTDHNTKNTREEEQLRNKQSDKDEPGFLSTLMLSMKKTAAERPPFVMEIYEAEERREVSFDPLTGRPTADTGSTRDYSPSLPVQPVSSPTPATGDTNLEADFPIDFLDD